MRLYWSTRCQLTRSPRQFTACSPTCNCAPSSSSADMSVLNPSRGKGARPRRCRSLSRSRDPVDHPRHRWRGSADAMTIQFGILLDEPRLRRWQLSCLQRLLALGDVRAVALIRGPGVPDGAVQTYAPDAEPGWNGGLHADPPGSEGYGSPDQAVALPKQIAALPTELPAGLDFILAFTHGPCPAPLLQSTRWGVWRYQFGDWTRFRGEPVGF